MPPGIPWGFDFRAFKTLFVIIVKYLQISRKQIETLLCESAAAALHASIANFISYWVRSGVSAHAEPLHLAS